MNKTIYFLGPKTSYSDLAKEEFAKKLGLVEYIEKPKRLYFAVEQGRMVSCMDAVQNAQYDLFGQGVLVAIIDSGVDFYHPDFFLKRLDYFGKICNNIIE